MRELSLNNCRLDKRYDIRDGLGRGSYAEIFVARDTLASPQSPHSTVVIKALNVFLQDDLDADLERTLVENFQNEAIALDRVRHPNVISRIGHGTARDLKGTVFHYLVLEYLPGGDLQNAVRRGRIPLKRSIRYIEQVCAGLAHAHSRGIIHRDIKPQNLLLTADHETVKIADFGVARINLNDAPITRVGTNIYAPPEHSPLSIVQGRSDEPARLTLAADVYSLAKSAYTLITGEAPRAFANSRITALPDDFRDDEWSDDLLRVLSRATADEPIERHQSVDEFWNDLAAFRQIVEDGEVSTVVRTRPEQPQAHVARGYTPIVPPQPQFEPVSDPALRVAASSDRMQPLMPPRQPSAFVPPSPKAEIETPSSVNPIRPNPPIALTPPKRRKALRRLATFGIFLILFTGILYGTHSYMSGLGILPAILNPFGTKTAVANTDIFLRSTPNTDNDPIGLVTKKSKVRVVNAQNNWYQVEVVEQGRVGNFPATATRGWLYGKYLDIDGN
ncbi:MAG TPA: protein kinase [Pyrinomonadaceae bacterium]|nr:protein kinase [Chloracidobacterium sp.]MBP9936443.1 protein kinase [Pyrinomonadaceae bacterium]MBL0239383.1 protein kinase [Chloracidobacterium sp.]HQX55317.1 protein kinase [Pyrinomonadaceae bacterium]HQY67870.1 protein kinase [Pyrinomonadaceae bacterium]